MPDWLPDLNVSRLSGSPPPPGNGSAAGELPHFQHHGQFPAPVSILLAVLMGLVVLVTVLGNALVILAFVVDRSLQTQGNFFFLNLAIADLLVGGFCIPLYIPYILTGEWKFGRGLCKLWLVADYLVCTASVFNIVLISFDRYISVTKAVSYRAQKGMTRNAVIKMVMVWIAAFLLYGPAIISWEYIAQRSILPEKECYAEFFYNWYFLMTASTLEFFTPFISVTYFNLSIYFNIRKRTPVRTENLPPDQDNCEMHPLGKTQGRGLFLMKLASRNRSQRMHNSSPSNPEPRALSIQNLESQVVECNLGQDLPPLQMDTQRTKSPWAGFYKALESLSNTTRRTEIAHTMASRFRLSRDKRVAKSLAIIVCIFGLCWAPYTLLMIIRAACHGQCIPHALYEASFWLLWLNSAINPILYPLCHMSFRKAFFKLLCPGKAKIHPNLFL
ncbi:histamine H3 receptor-like [Hemicordylus capensis]|uniref:histamine H3 receptor-like n=1 Tax=Hemicordylus capensis TaxID=884348 RepID=UPI002303B37B|nr:histamine H3 receptor-like [Hemicordylus capensis]